MSAWRRLWLASPPVCTMRVVCMHAVYGPVLFVDGDMADDGQTLPQMPLPSPLRSGAARGPQLPPPLIYAAAPDAVPSIG